MVKKESEKPLAKKSILREIISKIQNNPLKSLFRPKDIPITAPDCGWNHGKPKEK